MKAHVVAFALPWQGHINPLFQFVRKLAETGTVVTFVNTEARHAELLNANGGHDPFAASATALGLDIRFATVSDGLPLDFDRYVHRNEFCESVRCSMSYHMEKLLSKLVMQESPPVSCLLADTFFNKAAEIAEKFELLFASFYTESVAVYSIYSHCNDLVANKHLPYPETANCNKKVIDYLTGLSPMRILDLPSFLQETDLNNTIYKMIAESYESIKKADWVISNTVDELEYSTVSALKKSGIPFLSVGPLLPEEFKDRLDNPAQPKEIGFSCRASLLPEFDLSEWLDSKPKESVIYISFGSFSQCTSEMLHEFAMGLMQSKQPFVWVLRPGAKYGCCAGEETLSKEFTEAIKDQGIIVKWCNQLDVLRHPSVGAFVTHCGWNSTLEGLWIGVPLLCFPLFADQYTNSWILTEQLGIAKSVGFVNCRSKDNIRVAAVPRHEIATCLEDFMTRAEQRSEAKAKAEWAKGVVRKAVMDENGSSVRNFKLFLEGLTATTAFQRGIKASQS